MGSFVQEEISMNKLNTTMLAAVVVGLLAGCASTSNDSQAPAQYPVLKVLSDKPYVWDDSISEALNVARMAQPAGVGNGMQDFSDGTLANTGRIGGGMRAFDAGLGLLSKGIFGVIQHEALSQGVNRQVDWKPSLVNLFEKTQIEHGGKIDFKKTRDIVLKKIIEAISAEYKDVEVIAFATAKDLRNSPVNGVVIFKSSSCLDSLKLDNYYEKNAKPRMLGTNYNFIESPLILDDFCAIQIRMSIASEFNNKYVVVSELIATGSGTYYYNNVIEKNIKNTYFISPEYYDFVVKDRIGVKKGVHHEYARVFFNGREILFQK